MKEENKTKSAKTTKTTKQTKETKTVAKTKPAKAAAKKEVKQTVKPAAKKTVKEQKVETKAATKKDTKNVKTTKNAQKTPQKREKTAKNAEKTKRVGQKEVVPQKIVGFNGLALNTYIYDNVASPKAVVVIVHGMMEHALRYKNFAEFLNKNGYIVIANDLRGHGHTAPSKDRLGFGEEDIFQETLKDELNVINFASEKYKLPIYVFGHSYGSMISQVLMQLTNVVEKCVICGTTNGNALNMRMGNLLAHTLSPFRDPEGEGGMIEKIVMKSFEKGFDRGNWLTRDEAVFDAYNQDEYCGGSFPFGFYKSLMINMGKANDGIDKIGNKKLFLIVGSEDPVGQKSKQVRKLYNLYLKHNIDAKFKVYDGARHELLNETNKEEVYEDVLNFFNS